MTRATVNGLDITEHLRVLYDLSCEEAKGSRGLCIEEIESILLVGRVMGFKQVNLEYVEPIDEFAYTKSAPWKSHTPSSWQEFYVAKAAELAELAEWRAQVGAKVAARIAELTGSDDGSTEEV